MKIIHRARSQGKTYELLQMMLKDESAIFVALTVERANNAWKAAATLNGGVQLDKSRFRSVHQIGQWRNGYSSMKDKVLLVDELESCLSALLGNNTIGAVTSSADLDSLRDHRSAS